MWKFVHGKHSSMAMYSWQAQIIFFLIFSQTFFSKNISFSYTSSVFFYFIFVVSCSLFTQFLHFHSLFTTLPSSFLFHASFLCLIAAGWNLLHIPCSSAFLQSYTIAAFCYSITPTQTKLSKADQNCVGSQSLKRLSGQWPNIADNKTIHILIWTLRWVKKKTTVTHLVFAAFCLAVWLNTQTVQKSVSKNIFLIIILLIKFAPRSSIDHEWVWLLCKTFFQHKILDGFKVWSCSQNSFFGFIMLNLDLTNCTDNKPVLACAVGNRHAGFLTFLPVFNNMLGSL